MTPVPHYGTVTDHEADMTVKVVTDSTSDLPATLAKREGIHIVPVHVHFEKKSFLDGVDISPAEFYRKLENSTVNPTTSQPSVGDFMGAYKQLAEERNVEGIVSVHISSKISGTCSSAEKAAFLGPQFPVKVVDSGLNSIGLGLVALAAARLARAGENLENVLAGTMSAIARTDMYGIFDTMKYIVRGGRISRTQATVAKVIGVKPMLKFSDGSIVRGGLARTYKKGMEKLVDFARSKANLKHLAIAHAAVPEKAQELKERLSQFFKEEEILVTELGPALGAHGGPGVLLVATQVAGQED